MPRAAQANVRENRSFAMMTGVTTERPPASLQFDLELDMLDREENLMLATVYLTHGETAAWADNADLRSMLRSYASERAALKNRRFFQLVGTDGGIVATGEVEVR